MHGIDELLANNAHFVERFRIGHLDVRPSRRLAIIACMDSRLDVFGALGPKLGEAEQPAQSPIGASSWIFNRVIGTPSLQRPLERCRGVSPSA